MNIVYVSDQYWPSVSGVSVSIDTFKDKFTKMGHQVTLLVPEYPEAASYDKRHHSQNIYRFKSYSLIFNKENRLVYQSEEAKIFERLDQIKPDIIHVHS